jgi:dihydropyrimidinase
MCRQALEEDEESCSMKILIKNGIIVSSTDRYKSDILINNGRIDSIEPHIDADGVSRLIDADGRYVFPGGIDPHVHMHLPGPAGFSSDDFSSGSRAAFFGGTTTLLDFVTPGRGESLTHALSERIAEAENSLADYSFHVSPVEWRNTTESEIAECIRMGVTSFKVYMAYKDSIGLNDSDILKVMKAVGKAGGLVTAHCESGDEIEILRNKFISENHFEPAYHPLSRPSEYESGAVKRAIDMAFLADCPLYIVHVSAKESVMHIQEAKGRGQRVFAETCPQYLLLDDAKYAGEFSTTAPYVISPPLRKKEDNDSLWDAVSGGIIDTIGTDHCPFRREQKASGLNDFRKIPGGAGGVEHRLEMMFTYGVLEKRITLNRMIDLCSARPAKIFGLYPGKGEIMAGSDADLVIWDPDSENTISAKTHKQNCDINIFEGIITKGVSEYVIARGKFVIEKGDLVNADYRGNFLKR